MELPTELQEHIKSFLFDYNRMYWKSIYEQENVYRYFASDEFNKDLMWNGYTTFYCRRCRERTHVYWDGYPLFYYMPFCDDCNSVSSYYSNYSYYSYDSYEDQIVFGRWTTD